MIKPDVSPDAPQRNAVPPRATPEVTQVNQPFWDAATNHRLVIQRCTVCGRFQHEPLESCPACCGKFEWIEVSGRGIIHTFTIIHQVYHSAFASEVPYNVSIVELDEGPLMVTNIVGCDSSELAIDLPVEVDFIDVEAGISLPVFRLAADLQDSPRHNGVQAK